MITDCAVPAAAEKAGMTRLVLCDDFDSRESIDWSGDGKPGYTWFTDRPYKFPQLTDKDMYLKDSVLYMAPEVCGSAIGLCSYSRKGDTGFAYLYGYAEARIRFDAPVGPYNGVPAFWGIGKNDFMDRPWTDNHCGELDILEGYCPEGYDGVVYTGTIHDHWRTPEGQLNGANMINALGFDRFDPLDSAWHTYAALWEPGHIVWYVDGQPMHAARFSKDALPEYYDHDDDTPLPRYEDRHPELGAKRTWVGCHSILESDEQVLILGCNKNWPMEVDWVRVWQK